MKIITSGLTRDTDIEHGKINDIKSFSLYYNKSIYRFIYELNSKKDVERFLNDFKSLKFENCDNEETDGGENYSIEYFHDNNKEKPINGYNFEGDGVIEKNTIDYEYDWLHRVTLYLDNKEVFVKCGSFNQFEETNEGKQIISIFEKV
jgi:hypothetical protein